MIRSTLVEKTQMQIKDMILRKEYDENNYLPSEGALCEKFGISRVTVREAVRSLEVRGFLRREHGKGILVTDNSVQTMSRFISDMLTMNYSDMLELIEVRSIIEVEAARLAALRVGRKELEPLRKCLAVMEATEVMDEAYYTSDMEFHVNLVNACGNNLLRTFVHAYTPILRNVVIASSLVDYCIEKRFHYHRRVYDCIASGDAEGAAAEMRIHMNANEEYFLAHLDGNACATEEEPEGKGRMPSVRAKPGSAKRKREGKKP